KRKSGLCKHARNPPKSCRQPLLQAASSHLLLAFYFLSALLAVLRSVLDPLRGDIIIMGRVGFRCVGCLVSVQLLLITTS
ncbi:hypothetical protein C8R45DRAFT_1032474, partial [Mycena sanguinolenta]